MLLQAGAATALHWAVNSVKKGGIVSVVGVYGPTDNLVPIGNAVNKGITTRAGQTSVKRLVPKLIEHVQKDVLHPKDIITHRFALEDAADAYHIFSSKLDDCIKKASNILLEKRLEYAMETGEEIDLKKVGIGLAFAITVAALTRRK